MDDMPRSERTGGRHPSKSARRRFRHRRNRGRYAGLDLQNGIESVQDGLTFTLETDAVGNIFWNSFRSDTGPREFVRVQPGRTANGNVTLVDSPYPIPHNDPLMEFHDFATEARQFLRERWVAVIEDLYNPNLDPADRPVVYESAESPDDGSIDVLNGIDGPPNEVVGGNLQPSAAADTSIDSQLSQLNMK